MGELFKNILSDSESLFSNPIALDVDFTPPILKFRENEQQYIATAIKPLFQRRNGKNLIIHGSPGIGKTVATLHVLEEVKKETDEIECLYVNCWKKETPFKIIVDFCQQLGYTWTHNKSFDELLKVVTEMLNKKNAVLVLDEIDQLEDQGILYTLLDEVMRKTIILITNNPEYGVELDQRIRSRLVPEMVTFKPYTENETEAILRERIEFAFVPNVWEQEALPLIVQETVKGKDVRLGLFLLRNAGDCAENKASRKILKTHAEEAIKKIPDFQRKKVEQMNPDEKQILALVKANSGKTSSELYELYQKNGGKKSMRTFQRSIKELIDGKFISSKEINKGFDAGRKNVLEFGKTLSDFQ
ncbi:AAA family ATPase [Candidatus Woesearchaeota archaeon]|nr:AAA family ATPase [Candidatus Woesearchaeota archaeon]